MARLLLWRQFVTLTVLSFVSAHRIRDMIYVPLDGAAACFRRHNGTHQFGCSSSRSGSVGVVHIVEVEDDVRWLEQNATAGPYAVVMPFSFFRRDVLIRLRDTNNINGVLLARNTTKDRPPSYSPDDACPNRYSGYKKCGSSDVWNPYGSALLFEDWPFPMFYMKNETLLGAIKACFWRYNAHDLETQSERSLCALEMRSFMFAAINSESCMKRGESILSANPIQYCDPLGDRNIHWPLTPLKSANNTIIMVTSRIDASSLFDGLSPGVGSAITGLVTLLATAQYLGELHPTVKDTNVVFSLLNGEAFDYIGSSRMVYDLRNGHFNSLGGVKLKLDEVQSVIELGQVGIGNISLHTVNDEDNAMISELSKMWNATILKDSVPPSSVQSFLKAKSTLPVVVIANHGEKFVNKYYNGILDDAEAVHYDRYKPNELASSLADVAVHLAEVLYKSVVGSEPPAGNRSAAENLISDMLYCYVENANCTLFRAASSPGHKLADQVLPLYVSVHRSSNPSTIYTGQLLALLTGEKYPEMNESTCHEKHLLWMGGYNFTGLCINSTVNYSMAVSPAFIIDGYDMKSGNYSSWTESTWESISVRMFLKPSAPVERLSVILGSLVTGMSFIFVWFVNSRADILFSSSRAANC